MNPILETLRSLDGVLELAPGPGSEFPELAWGDHFFYYAPDGQVPQREQPYATIVTKDYPDDDRSDLNLPDRWRLNIRVGREMFRELTGEDPREDGAARDHAVSDVVLPHPVYRSQGWVAIVNPGTHTMELATDLLRQAHDAARRRSERRGAQPAQETGDAPK